MPELHPFKPRLSLTVDLTHSTMGNPQSKSAKIGHPEHWDPVDSKSGPSSAYTKIPSHRNNRSYYKATDPTLISGIENGVRWIDWAYVPKEKTVVAPTSPDPPVTVVTPSTLILGWGKKEEVGCQDVRLFRPMRGREGEEEKELQLSLSDAALLRKREKRSRGAAVLAQV